MSAGARQLTLARLKVEEGCRLHAYPDPKSGGAPYTVGFGHAVGVKPGDVWTQARADDVLVKDVQQCEAQLNHALPWWTKLDDVRASVLLDMCFNLGIAKLLKFHNTLAAIERGDYAAAAAGMAASQWAKDVHGRADHLEHEMLTGSAR